MIEGTTDQLARMLSCDPSEIRTAIEELSVTKIADVTERNDFVTIINRRMFREERIRKQTRSRVERFRNAEVKRESNGPVTHASSSSSSSSSSCTKVHNKHIGVFALPDWVPEIEWDAYVEMRKKIKKPLSDHAKDLAVKKLHDLKEAGNNPSAVLNQSTFNDWQGLFELKENAYGKSRSNQRHDGPFSKYVRPSKRPGGNGAGVSEIPREVHGQTGGDSWLEGDRGVEEVADSGGPDRED
jgi:hypothetical protein